MRGQLRSIPKVLSWDLFWCSMEVLVGFWKDMLLYGFLCRCFPLLSRVREQFVMILLDYNCILGWEAVQLRTSPMSMLFCHQELSLFTGSPWLNNWLLSNLFWNYSRPPWGYLRPGSEVPVLPPCGHVTTRWACWARGNWPRIWIVCIMYLILWWFSPKMEVNAVFWQNWTIANHWFS